ncbi:MAG: hypothetical protein M1834_007149 [Cirrosporium novae-zelandiae]|nr:MAG: hypothetical protein M1834_007149 [Cirrosporium novae-zelandiae]
MDLLEILLERGVSPNYGVDGISNSALHDAALLAQGAMLGPLLSSGAEISARDGKERTVLHICCQFGLFESGKMLLRQNVDPNQVDNNMLTPLHYVAGVEIGDKEEDCLSLTKRLIKKRAICLVQDRQGRTPLMQFLTRNKQMSKAKKISMLKLICPSSSAVLCQNKDNANALRLATQWHDYSVMSYLLELIHGAGMDTHDEVGCFPLYLAFNQRDKKLMKLVLELNPPPLKNLVYEGQSILDQAIIHGNKAIVQKTLELAPSLINPTDDMDHAPLITAANHTKVEIFRILLEQGCNVFFACADRSVVFHQVCKMGNVEMAQLLIRYKAWLHPYPEKGTEPIRDIVNETVLHSGAQSLSPTLIQILLQLPGLNVNDTNAAGALVNELNNAGKSALDFALKRGDPAILEVLFGSRPIPGLLWPEMSPEIVRWVKYPWFRLLEPFQGDAMSQPKSKFKRDPGWRVHKARTTKYGRFSENSPDVPYLNFAVPGSGTSRVRRIIFKAISHDQGNWEEETWGQTFQHSWTWFEAGVAGMQSMRTARPLELPRRTIHRNVHASGRYYQRITIWDYRDPEPGLRSWLASINPGDIVSIYVKALYGAWENHVKEVEILLYYEETPSLITPRSPLRSKDSPGFLLPSQRHSPKIISYIQTHHTDSGSPISLRPLADKGTSVTTSKKYNTLRDDIIYLQNAKIKVLAMLGGAARGSFKRLDGDPESFIKFYYPLRRFLKIHKFDGIDLDIEEPMPLDGVTRLIDQLRLDFGPPIRIRLRAIRAMTWTRNRVSYANIARRGWPLHKVILGRSTNPETHGYTSIDDLDQILAKIANDIPDSHLNFGGVMGWEYFNSMPGGTDRPWEWASSVSSLIKKHFDQNTNPPSPNKNDNVTVGLMASEVSKIAHAPVDDTVNVEMKVIDHSGIHNVGRRDDNDDEQGRNNDENGGNFGNDDVVSMEMKIVKK